ncbi:MAG: type II secretion system protein [Opitutales bacterium]|nr:type II secretion system protein [Opitutales bacterium]
MPPYHRQHTHPGSGEAARHRGRAGFSLIEVVVAMVLLSILAAGLISSTMHIRRAAEANMREALAVAVGTGFLEQLISAEYNLLQAAADTNALWDFFTRDGSPEPVRIRPVGYDGDGDTIEIPLVTDTEGQETTSMPLQILPMVERADGNPDNALNIIVRIRWNEALSNEERTRSFVYVRSRVPR